MVAAALSSAVWASAVVAVTSPSTMYAVSPAQNAMVATSASPRPHGGSEGNQAGRMAVMLLQFGPPRGRFGPKQDEGPFPHPAGGTSLRRREVLRGVDAVRAVGRRGGAVDVDVGREADLTRGEG